MVRALSPSGRGEVALILQVVYLATQVLLLGTERSFVASYHDVTPAAAVRAYARLLVVPVRAGRVRRGRLRRAGTGALRPGAGRAHPDRRLRGRRGHQPGDPGHRDRRRPRARLPVRPHRRVPAAAGDAGHPVRRRHHAARPCGSSPTCSSGALPTLAYLVLLAAAAGPGRRADRPTTALVRREGLALFPAALSNMAMLRADRLALPVLASTSALGLYAAVATMTELLAWPLRAYADSRLGKWRAAHREGAPAHPPDRHRRGRLLPGRGTDRGRRALPAHRARLRRAVRARPRPSCCRWSPPPASTPSPGSAWACSSPGGTAPWSPPRRSPASRSASRRTCC